MDTAKSRVRAGLKGFTLIELLVVMAIIAILAGMISIFVSGFMRDARMETDNNRAQLIYTGFQNMLLQCEIKQDTAIFGGGSKYAFVEMTVDSNQAPDATLGDAAKITDVKITPDGGTALTLTTSTVPTLDDFRKTAVKEFSLTFDGKFLVYMNLEDYLVESACYFENASEADPSKLLSCTSAVASMTYRTMTDVSDYQNTKSGVYQQKLANSGIYAGAYPMANAVA